MMTMKTRSSWLDYGQFFARVPYVGDPNRVRSAVFSCLFAVPFALLLVVSGCASEGKSDEAKSGEGIPVRLSETPVDHREAGPD